ncbi:hypothetical protein [Pseudoalteromonas sp. MMG010]|uniref:hypothetical protein n=1 Tax=Pseudoalteromonas sp. MMG010 TaxID=2822685 RepID=UPI001FFDC0FC|nr:hypothetical protein [Pseudoalteromonas sp. MMG010]
MNKITYLALSLFVVLFSVNSIAQQKMMDHSHLPIVVPSNAPTPALSLKLTVDAMSGYNLILDTQRYDLSVPPAGKMDMQAMMSPAFNQHTGFLQGHAHLYINGIKIQRVYGHALHLPASLFKNGMNTISVTLNNHGHMYWTAQDKKIVSTLYINTLLAKPITYKFESFPVNENS